MIAPLHNGSDTSEIAAFILAGGRSRRFGSDKALFMYRGRPLIEHVIGAVRPGIGSISIIADDSERFRHLGLPCHPDIVKGIGPLGGIYTALSLCGKGHALVLGCDTPFLSPGLISFLIRIRAEGDIIIPCYREMYEPLHALYSSRCLPAVENALRTEKRQAVSFFGDVNVRTVGEAEIRRFADPDIVFRNFNYRHDVVDDSPH